MRVTAPRCLCSASPFNANARRNSAVPSLFQSPRTEAIPLRTVPWYSSLLYALASLCTCFFAPMHVLWPLIPRSAGQIPAMPQLCSLRLSAAVRHASFPFRVAAKLCQSTSFPRRAHANRSTSELLHCASARCTSMQFLCHSRHCYSAAVVRHSVAYAP